MTSTTRDGDSSLDARRVLVARALRGFADGFVSVLLADYLTRLGFTPLEVGAIVTGTLLGSAALTIAVGLVGYRLPYRAILLAASLLMLATGLGFAAFQSFWPLFLVAVVGTLNPSSGDVSVFLPIEQALLADRVPESRRTAAFAWFNVSGGFAAALGALASGAPELLAGRAGIDVASAERCGFGLYAAIAVAVALAYRGLSRSSRPGTAAPAAPLVRSRRVVFHLAALFSLDSFGGGFAVQSLLVLWLYRRFGLSIQTAALVFFVAGLLAAWSQLVSSRLAARIGLVRTMVYTHLPANLFLLLAGFAPNASVAIALLLARMALSSMDVPARQAFVMAVVPPEERPAAASLTNVPRSLAAALAPVLAGLLLEHSTFGWPLIIGGALKALYDVLLLVQFGAVPPYSGRSIGPTRRASAEARARCR